MTVLRLIGPFLFLASLTWGQCNKLVLNPITGMFDCTGGSGGGGTGNGVVSTTFTTQTSATLTHNAGISGSGNVPWSCVQATTNAPLIPTSVVFTANAVTFTFSPAESGTCTAGTGGTGLTVGTGTAGTLPVFTGASQIGDSLVSQSGSVVNVNGFSVSNAANVKLATLAGGSSQSTNPLLDVTNSAGSSHWLTVLGDGKVGIGTNAPSYSLHSLGTIGGASFFSTGGISLANFLTDNAGSRPYIDFSGTARLSIVERTTATAALTVLNTGPVGAGRGNTSPTGTLSILDRTGGSGATSLLVGSDGTNTSATTTQLVVKAGTAQSTTNLQEWQNAAGTVLGYIGSTGILSAATSVQGRDAASNWSTVEANTIASHATTSSIIGALLSSGLDAGAGLYQASPYVVAWTSSATNAKAGADTSLSRIAAGIVGVGTGTAGSTAGTLQAATLQALGNGSASNPMLLGSGTWFTGGSATTTKPYLLVEPSGTTSTGWSTSGTGIGVNAASGFAGNLLDLQVAGVSKVNISGAGNLTIANLLSAPFYGGTTDGVVRLSNNTASGFDRLQFGGTSALFPALKRSSAGLIARLADDSADTWVQASQFRSTLTTPASAAATCTTGTIVADTGFVYVCTATDTWKRVAIASW